MSQIKPQFEVQLQKIEQTLSQITQIDQGIKKIKQIKQILVNLKNDDVYNMKDFIIKHLKPISRDLTNANIKQIKQQQRQILQQTMYAIVGLYAKAARFRYQILAFQILPQLLERSTFLFRTDKKYSSSFNNELETQKGPTVQNQFQWVLLKNVNRENNTYFYYKCINLIMETLCGIEDYFVSTGLNFVKQYINFLIKMSSNLKSNKLTQYVQSVLDRLQILMINSANSKQSLKQLNLDATRAISDLSSKIGNVCAKPQIKKRFQMLASIYGLSLFGSASIEKKINGLKIINRQAQNFYRTSLSFMKEQQYIIWLYKNKVIQTILEQSYQSPILKYCNYIFRMIFKGHCLNTENLQKIFNYVQQANIENRQIILRNLDLQSNKLQYNDYQLLIKILNKPYKSQFYQQDLFSIAGQCIRYSTANLLKQFIDAIGKIIEGSFGKFRNQKIQNRCIKCFVKAIIRLFQKIQEYDKKKEQFLTLFDKYTGKQFKLIGILIFKNLIDDLPQISDLSKSKAAILLIKQRQIIQNGLLAIEKTQNLALKAEIQQFIYMNLKKSDAYDSEKVSFTSQIFIKAVHSPKIFEKITIFVPYNSQQLLNTFQKLLSMYSVQKIPFSCIKMTFFRLNFIYIRQIKQYNQQSRFEILGKISSLKGVDSLKSLLYTSTSAENRTQIAEFIVDIYTNYSQSRLAEAQAELQQALTQSLKLVLHNFHNKEQSNIILGSLALVAAFMMGTQTLGVGNYRPHNSLVPISTVQIKIVNDITYGNDVAQSYWKKVSSNMILFDLLTEMGQKFRCTSCQISLQEGEQYWSDKLNGLTLQQLKIDDKLLKAVKSSKQKIRKDKLMQNQQLTPKITKVFEQIFNNFAVQGKMGKKQCSNFVAGVTKTPSSIHDGRVIQFFRQYDLDKDDSLTFQDFIKFYKYHCAPERDQIVWKNLLNMRYRKDLKKYDDPVEITNQRLLFRSMLYKSDQFYSMLFALSQSQNKQLGAISKKLLLRLPTYSKTLDSLSSDLDLISKNCFQTQYLLIAIQSKLAERQLNIEDHEKNKNLFIESGNSIKIFEMMLRITNKQNASQQQIKCLYISLQILRSILKIPDLKTTITSTQMVKNNIKLPQTDLFINLAQKSLKNVDIDILQASLALQMTQNQKSIDFALQGIFCEEAVIRKICCNYIYILYIHDEVNIDLFEIQQKSNNQIWFETLSKICEYGKNVNYFDVILKCISKIKHRQQTIEGNQDDQLIFGNLSIIWTILKQTNKVYQDISCNIIQISQKVISNRSRRVIYHILAHFDISFATQFVSSLIENITPVKEVEPKKYYVGLKNLGSTCYMNSVLQVLFFVQEFKSLILSHEVPSTQMVQVNDKKIYDNTFYQLQVMYTYLIKSTKKFYAPQQFCSTLKKIGTNEPIDQRVQEDAHEFVGKFLDKIQKQLQKTEKINDFRQLIQGNTVTQILCRKCSNKINRQQKFCQLSLAVQGNKSLQQSFQKYILPEQIEDYFCTTCNCKVQKIQKSILLQKLPKLLIINLQRIIFDLQNFMNKKIDSSFSFPENLNVLNYVNKQSNLSAEDCQYSIKAIVVHSGTSQCGHYYSFIRIQNNWYKFNDQTVTKINYKDILHQCFGGSESKQQWSDDMKFSTNAYILFYEKKDKKIIDQAKYTLNQQLCLKIQQENQKFYKQVQIHQQSVFLFANQIFQKYVPHDIEQRMKYSTHALTWMEDQNCNYYEIIYQFQIKILKFATVFYDIKTDYVFKIGQNLFKLFFLLPQKSYSFLTQILPDECVQNLCLHNDETIRSIYKYLLNKSLHIFINYYNLTVDSQQAGCIQVLQLIDSLFAFMQDERFDKNILKIFHYLDFWKTCCQFMPMIVDYLINHDAITILVNKLMGSDSPLEKKNKNLQLGMMVSIPIINIIVYLMSRKKNFKNFINPIKMFENLNYYELTANQRLMLANTDFYTKMINRRFDGGQLGHLIARLCQADYQFSKQMAAVYLKGLNNTFNLQSAIIILNHLKSYLLIDDDFTLIRIKWILGIAQLHMQTQLVYKLEYDLQSTAVNYISPLIFTRYNQKQDIKSALQILYENHSTITDFSMKGVSLLLDLMCTSQKIFSYVLSLPAPTYTHKSYLDWIQKYIYFFKQSYLMEQRVNQKAILVSKLTQMYTYLTNKVSSSQLNLNLPVNKYIIGSNKQLNAIESTYNQDFKTTLWAHVTYKIDNQPQKNVNIKKQIMRQAVSQPLQPIAQEKHMQQSKSQTQNSTNLDYNLYTLQIQSKRLLKLKFKLQKFKQQIYVDKGKYFINFAYENDKNTIIDILDAQIIKKMQNVQIEKKSEQQKQTIIQKQEFSYYPAQEQNLANNICKLCTYINDPSQTFCYVCLNSLY